jgi:hypothetical protein
MKFIQTFLLIFVSILVGFGNLHSQSIEISVQDTVIDRGGTNVIPIHFVPQTTIMGEFYTEFIFNANVIDIKELNAIELDNEFITLLKYEIDLSDLNNAKLKISTKILQETVRGICYIKIEGLAGADTVTMLTPVKAMIDGVEIPETNFKAGKITVRSSAVIPGITEGLGQNRPNPFSAWTTFPFGINKDSDISFAVYGMGGRKILDDDNITEIFNIQILNESGEFFNDYKGKILKRGNYTISLSPNSWDLSSGTYFIVMKTESGVYKTNFMYVK